MKISKLFIGFNDGKKEATHQPNFEQYYFNPQTNEYERVYDNYQITDHKTKCALVAKLNKNQE